MSCNQHTSLVQACLDLLRLHRMPAWKNHTGAMAIPDSRRRGGARHVRFSLPGASDIFAILPGFGVFIGIECKTGKGKLTEDQRRFRDMVQAAGGMYWEIRDVGQLAVLLRRLSPKFGFRDGNEDAH